MRFDLVSAAAAATLLTSVLADPTITSFPNTLALSSKFDPIKPAYWTGLPHHRRTPFSVSPDGSRGYLAYLDSTYATVVVQQVDLTTFASVGDAFTTTAYEAAGLVAQNDGFALLATVNATETTTAANAPIVTIIRVQDGTEAWRTNLNGPGVHESAGLSASPDANGDLVYSAASGLYAAYFVVEAYSGDASGHFGDSIQYVDEAGALQTDQAASSTFGCSHNTGIGFEAADEAPFASICAEDNGAIWLNTDTRYMSGVKIANENTTNGASGEPMGGMSGSYSNLARFGNSSTDYMFGWQSRGAVNLATDAWLGSPYTTSSPRWLNHNVAIAAMTSKNKLLGAEASSAVGGDGDSQVTWITKSDTDDHQNVHVAAISSNAALVSWETLINPTCEPLPLSCTGTYAGTSFQIVDNTGALVGAPTVSTSVFVSGDIANVGTDKVCWPYVEMTWDLSQPASTGTLQSSMSFACASTGNATTPETTASVSTAVKIATSVSSAAVSSAFVSSAPASSAASDVQPTASASVTVPASEPVSSVPTSTSVQDGVTHVLQSTTVASSEYAGVYPTGSGVPHGYGPYPTGHFNHNHAHSSTLVKVARPTGGADDEEEDDCDAN